MVSLRLPASVAVDHAAVAAAVVASIAVPVDRVFAPMMTTRKAEGCSRRFDRVACLRPCRSILVGRRGGLGMLMPLNGLEVNSYSHIEICAKSCGVSLTRLIASSQCQVLNGSRRRASGLRLLGLKRYHPSETHFGSTADDR